MLGTAAERASDGVLRKMIDAAREGVLVVAADMRIVAANKTAHRAFSSFGQPLEAQLFTELMDDPGLVKAIGNACSDDKKTTDIHLKYGPKGMRRRYDVHVAPLELGGRRNAIGFFNDVTQVHRLENIRQEFLSNISHELRTPLTSILAFVETLEEGGLDDAENNRHFLSVIRRNGERMRNLIADILELSQIEAGTITLTRQTVKLSHVVDEIMTSLSSMAAEREINLENRVSASSQLLADAKRLEQMLTNLIDNAVRFNRRGGSVTVTDEALADRYLINVSDTGEGIGQKELHRIFERFYRVDRARTREVGGTGLGLAIVKHLARLHGGEVTVESEPGAGTTFTIDLPTS